MSEEKMTVDRLVKHLQDLQKNGKGDLLVYHQIDAITAEEIGSGDIGYPESKKDRRTFLILHSKNNADKIFNPLD